MARSAVDTLLRKQSHLSAVLSVILTMLWWFGGEFNGVDVVPVVNGFILLGCIVFVSLKLNFCAHRPNFEVLLAIGDALMEDTASLVKFMLSGSFGLLLLLGVFVFVYLINLMDVKFLTLLWMVFVTRHCVVAVSEYFHIGGKKLYAFAMEDAPIDMDAHGRVRCGVCVKDGITAKYYDWKDLNHHVLQRHEKNLFCDVCWMTSFKKSHDLRKHMNDDHRVLKKEKCVECGSRYFTLYGRMKHEYRAHGLHRDDEELAAQMAEEANE